VPVWLQAHVGAGLGGAIELLEVHADGAIEAEQIGSDRGSGGICDADATHAEHVAQRSVDGNTSRAVQHSVEDGHTRLAVEDLGPATPRYPEELVEQSAFGQR